MESKPEGQVNEVEYWICLITDDITKREAVLDLDLELVLEWVKIKMLQTGATLQRESPE